jgi:hypothetical protein
MYLCVGHSKGAAKIKVNFGEDDFVWDGAKALALNEGGSKRLRRKMTDLSEYLG